MTERTTRQHLDSALEELEERSGLDLVLEHDRSGYRVWIDNGDGQRQLTRTGTRTATWNQIRSCTALMYGMYDRYGEQAAEINRERESSMSGGIFDADEFVHGACPTCNRRYLIHRDSRCMNPDCDCGEIEILCNCGTATVIDQTMLSTGLLFTVRTYQEGNE